MSSLLNHLNDEMQPTSDDLSNNTKNLSRTDQVTFPFNVCNLQSFTTFLVMNQYLRSCLEKPRDSYVNTVASHLCSSRTNVKNQREDLVNSL